MKEEEEEEGEKEMDVADSNAHAAQLEHRLGRRRRGRKRSAVIAPAHSPFLSIIFDLPQEEGGWVAL